ncbi:hypothetical protein CLDAP_02010 [Caldilinea aerophila DSM 14535 = NBRC 104270]|uniref:Uncharacterized protein n=1 Tax=Caldilinea aerophila (strain DSM 14535 / JCM 11387 / NBRC 104270 / STL-6-O1) TaxID=926550 RepID=I0HZ03_CALAS|nr:hypothetical protein CLDAP_02010 [Caldilinea aerophila DSM 14535 = NBRC 104270]
MRREAGKSPYFIVHIPEKHSGQYNGTEIFLFSASLSVRFPLRNDFCQPGTNPLSMIFGKPHWLNSSQISCMYNT